MTKWEYCYVDAPPGGPAASGDCKVYTLNKDGKHWMGHGKFGPVLAALGLEGWELCAATTYIEGGKVRMVHLLKRQLEG